MRGFPCNQLIGLRDSPNVQGIRVSAGRNQAAITRPIHVKCQHGGHPLRLPLARRFLPHHYRPRLSHILSLHKNNSDERAIGRNLDAGEGFVRLLQAANELAAGRVDECENLVSAPGNHLPAISREIHGQRLKHKIAILSDQLSGVGVIHANSNT